MKNRGLIITLIVLLIITIIALITLMIFLISNNGRRNKWFFSSKISTELIMDKTYDNKFDIINIDVSTSDVDIKSTSDDNIRVVVYGKKDLLEVNDSSNELSINFKEKNCFGFCFNLTKNKVEIYLPSDYDKKIVVDNDYGDINIDKFLNSNMNIEEDCGDVEILGANTLNVKNNYGDIEIDEAQVMNIEQDCGDIKVDKVNDITAKNKYGDIKIKNVLNYLNITNNCGDIKIDNLTINKNSSINDDLGSIKIGSTNDIYIEAKTDLGDVKVNNNNRKSNITLNIKNDCGDIKVDN